LFDVFAKIQNQAKVVFAKTKKICFAKNQKS
jgi:hypothetical protein